MDFDKDWIKGTMLLYGVSESVAKIRYKEMLKKRAVKIEKEKNTNESSRNIK